MRVLIEANADTISGLYTALTELRRVIKQQTKKMKLNPLYDEFELETEFEDDNCYGGIQMRVVPEPV